MSEPEPIPGSLAPDMADAETRRPRRTGLIAAAAALVVVLGTGAGLFFARDLVMNMIPMTKSLYAMIGMGGEALGAGLDIRSVASERANEGGVEVLAVRGVIANVSAVDRTVPNLRVALYDANNKMVQSTSANPAKTQLAAGAEIGFRVPLRDPSPLARRLEVTFIEGDKAPAGPPPGEPKGESKGETKSGG
jgi:hypothetical protein